MPVEIEVLSHELDAETELHVHQVNTHHRLLVTFYWRSLGNDQLPILEGQFLDVMSFEIHLVVDVNQVLDGFEPQLGPVGLLVAVMVDDDAHIAQPGHLLSFGIRNKHGIHIEPLVADEVEGKVVLSLDCVAEQLSIWKTHGKVRIVTKPTHRSAGEVVGTAQFCADLICLTRFTRTVLCIGSMEDKEEEKN